MKQKLGRVLAVLACVGAAALALVALGLIPAKVPETPQRTKLDVARTVEPAAATPVHKAPAPGQQARVLEGWVLPVCDAPDQGARLQRLSFGASERAFLLWCKTGYELIDLQVDGAGPKGARLARFKSTVEVPGGAAAGDFDADGIADLVLGTAPNVRAVHRPGAGAFLVRGRAQGGFEPARALVETPVADLAALELDGKPGTDLLLLTRGDLTAQRPAELWFLAGGSAMARQAIVPVGLGARELLLMNTAPDKQEAWIVLGQPGSLLRLELAPELTRGTQPEKSSVALPGVQGLISEGRGRGPLFARDASHVWRVLPGPEPQVERYAEAVNVGPSVLADLDGDAQPDVLAVVEDGVVLLSGEKGAERDLSVGARVLDVSSFRDASQAERAVALVVGPGSQQLGLALLPALPWDDAQEVLLRPGEVRDVPGFASVPLE